MRGGEWVECIVFEGPASPSSMMLKGEVVDAVQEGLTRHVHGASFELRGGRYCINRSSVFEYNIGYREQSRTYGGIKLSAIESQA